MVAVEQSGFDIRCEWGCAGAEALKECRTFIVVDVLSFSTCVSIAVSRQCVVLPYSWRDDSAPEFAIRNKAVLAGARGTRYSLSPESLENLAHGSRLVLPSPNGALISVAASAHGHVLAGCLRNSTAVCTRAADLGGPFAVIAAGERWPDGTLRYALEDLLGAGAIIAGLPGSRTPEAEASFSAFKMLNGSVQGAIASCLSGRELVERGYGRDVDLACMLDADAAAPELVDGAFIASNEFLP